MKIANSSNFLIQLETPVLFIVFNRIECTKKVFDSIKKVKPRRLYISSDGPRIDRVGENDKVIHIRNYLLSNIDWECEVKTLFHISNLGCKYAVSGAIDWFFQNEEYGIILEDDCLPSLSFFNFCSVLLERYKNDNRVMHIDGTTFLPNQNKLSYSFSKYALIWGWATWRRSWSKYDINLTNYDFLKKQDFLRNIWENKKVRNFWYMNFDSVFYTNFDTWDYQWFYTIWINNGLVIRPDQNLVKNIGFNLDATHTKRQPRYCRGLETKEYLIEYFPNEIYQDVLNDSYLSTYRFLIKSKFKRLLDNIM